MTRSATAPSPSNYHLRYDRARIYGVLAFIVIIAFIALAMMLASCTQTQRGTMTGAFATCAEGDLGAFVSPGVTVIDDVSGLIEGNAPTLEADLSGLAVTFGIAIIECAIAAVEAVLMAKPAPATGSGSGALVATAKAPPPGLVRARTWLVGQKTKLAATKSGSAK